jgi:hypothetical protein
MMGTLAKPMTALSAKLMSMNRKTMATWLHARVRNAIEAAAFSRRFVKFPAQ